MKGYTGKYSIGAFWILQYVKRNSERRVCHADNICKRFPSYLSGTLWDIIPEFLDQRHTDTIYEVSGQIGGITGS